MGDPFGRRARYVVTHYDPDIFIDSYGSIQQHLTLSGAKKIAKKILEKYPFKYKNAYITIELVKPICKVINGEGIKWE